jgi:L-ascorbate metabolism protein UlaG (beta-lactamase superfamily)
MAFIVYCEPGVRFYHYGDTALFSDLKLQGELYKPTVGCIGIANPTEILSSFVMPGRMMTAEMSPREGLLAAQWLGLKAVLPCHYIQPENDPLLRDFLSEADAAIERGEDVPEIVVLAPGECLDLEPLLE